MNVKYKFVQNYEYLILPLYNCYSKELDCIDTSNNKLPKIKLKHLAKRSRGLK